VSYADAACPQAEKEKKKPAQTRTRSTSSENCQWAQEDLNFRPHPYQGLTGGLWVVGDSPNRPFVVESLALIGSCRFRLFLALVLTHR